MTFHITPAEENAKSARVGELGTAIRNAIIAANDAGYTDARWIAGEVTNEAKHAASAFRDEATRELWDTFYKFAADIELRPF